MSKPTILGCLTLVLLSASAALLIVPYDDQETPLARPLELLPTNIGEWSVTDTPDDVLSPDRAAPAHLSRAYRNGRHTVWIDVVYYPRQTENHRLAAHHLVLPGRGWSELTVTRTTISVRDIVTKSLSANVAIMRAPSRQIATVYWYQVGADSISDDLAYRAMLVYNRLVHRRSHAALVRVASPLPDGADSGAIVAQQITFIQLFYQKLLRHFQYPEGAMA